jgi:hypothetical protein
LRVLQDALRFAASFASLREKLKICPIGAHFQQNEYPIS